MPLARHGAGPVPALRALGSQVHPVFMLPPVASSWFGATLVGSGEFAVAPAALHATAIFAAVYTAHVKDGYVDFHWRGEDDDHPLSPIGCRLALAGSTALFAACVALLWLAIDVGAALLTIPTWLIAFHHAPQLDTNPLTATTGYPAGIGLAILGGFYVQDGTLTALPVAFALVFLLVLSGVKVVDDAQDVDYDRTIQKRTVAVALGTAGARRLAIALMALGLGLVLALVALAVFPRSSVVAVLAFGGVAAIAKDAEPELATMLLVRGSYLFLAALVGAVWYRPLA